MKEDKKICLSVLETCSAKNNGDCELAGKCVFQGGTIKELDVSNLLHLKPLKTDKNIIEKLDISEYDNFSDSSSL